MSLTRRNFIETGSLSLLATFAAPSLLAENAPLRSVMQVEEARFSPESTAQLESTNELAFTRCIGESFSVSFNGAPLGSLTLISVGTLSTAVTATLTPSTLRSSLAVRKPVTPLKSVVAYSVRFQGSGQHLPQETYTFHLDAMGTFPLFIVPASPEANPDTYTAIFNLQASA
jgi:hypothetical protein